MFKFLSNSPENGEEESGTIPQNLEKLAAYEPCKGPGIRIVCISDTHARHGTLRPLPSGDVLIHAGDFTNTGSHKDILDFTEWIDAQPFKHKIFIAGNHDTSLHTSYYIDRGAARFHSRILNSTNPADYSAIARNIVQNCQSTYLEDSSTTILLTYPPSCTPVHEVAITSQSFDTALDVTKNGVNPDGAEPPGDMTELPQTNYSFDIYGSPWQPEFCDWAFNLGRGPECAAKWDCIPDGLDVLITHGPPLGYGDRLFPSGDRCGCEDMLQQIKGSSSPPRVHVFGHIHEDEGAWSDGRTLFVNATTCDFYYKPTNAPIVVHLPFDKSQPATIV